MMDSFDSKSAPGSMSTFHPSFHWNLLFFWWTTAPVWTSPLYLPIWNQSPARWVTSASSVKSRIQHLPRQNDQVQTAACHGQSGHLWTQGTANIQPTYRCHGAQRGCKPVAHQQERTQMGFIWAARYLKSQCFHIKIKISALEVGWGCSAGLTFPHGDCWLKLRSCPL